MFDELQQKSLRAQLCELIAECPDQKAGANKYRVSVANFLIDRLPRDGEAFEWADGANGCFLVDDLACFAFGGHRYGRGPFTLAEVGRMRLELAGMLPIRRVAR